MLKLNQVSCAPVKHMAAKAATTSFHTMKEAMGENPCKETSVLHLSRRDLSYFESDAFKASLKRWEDNQLAKEYGELIAHRKSMVNIDKAWDLVDAIIYVDILNAYYDGFNWSFGEVCSLFSGLRSQALREVKKTSGFNAKVYRELAKSLDPNTKRGKAEVRSFLKAINPIRVKNA